ncbi:hypothetical protein AB3Y40_06835 [Yoonia sp. R2331]|uniref:hypothetical protein n=1 Tax=Yoonia sp. R2331 TaxID=3237238 RepID=UPI0034E42FF2
MPDFDQSAFQKAKDQLDKAIRRVGALADEAEAAMVRCCRSDELDARDQFADLSAELRLAQGHLMKARSIGGKIETGDGVITRGGST